MWPYTDSIWDYVTFEPTETVRSPYDNGSVIVGEIVEDKALAVPVRVG